MNVRHLLVTGAALSGWALLPGAAAAAQLADAGDVYELYDDDAWLYDDEGWDRTSVPLGSWYSAYPSIAARRPLEHSYDPEPWGPLDSDTYETDYVHDTFEYERPLARGGDPGLDVDADALPPVGDPTEYQPYAGGLDTYDLTYDTFEYGGASWDYGRGLYGAGFYDDGYRDDDWFYDYYDRPYWPRYRDYGDWRYEPY